SNSLSVISLPPDCLVMVVFTFQIGLFIQIQNYQPPTINHQLTTINYQLPTINYQPPTKKACSEEQAF
ncbi:MAG: hypothetical protein IJS27_02450, partial [Ruminococcus sp.]|nr:hypothetical protein [Ruminococcus sp.]